MRRHSERQALHVPGASITVQAIWVVQWCLSIDT